MSINFSNEEAKAVLRESISKNLNNLTQLTKTVCKSSKSNDLFQQTFKQYSTVETNIDNTGDRLNKINILTAQLRFQQEAIEQDCKSLKEICNQVNSLLK